VHSYNGCACSLCERTALLRLALLSLLSLSAIASNAQSQAQDSSQGGLPSAGARAERIEKANQQSTCHSLINEIAVLLGTSEWVSLGRASQQFVRECDRPERRDNDYYISLALGLLAHAQRELGDSQRSLMAAEACRARNAANADCHLQAARTLAVLDLRQLALASYAAAARVARSNIEVARHSLLKTTDGPERDLLESEIEMNRLFQEDAEEMLNLHTPDHPSAIAG